MGAATPANLHAAQGARHGAQFGRCVGRAHGGIEQPAHDSLVVAPEQAQVKRHQQPAGPPQIPQEDDRTRCRHTDDLAHGLLRFSQMVQQRVAHDSIEAPVAKRQRRGAGAHESQALADTALTDAGAGLSQHRKGQIDANHEQPGAHSRNRDGNTGGSTSQIQRQPSPVEQRGGTARDLLIQADQMALGGRAGIRLDLG